jgi:hypothetical protein
LRAARHGVAEHVSQKVDLLALWTLGVGLSGDLHQRRKAALMLLDD